MDLVADWRNIGASPGSSRVLLPGALDEIHYFYHADSRVEQSNTLQKSSKVRFEMTALDHYLQAWELSRPSLLVESATSQIYKLEHRGVSAILKLLTPLGRKVEAGSSMALKRFRGYGAVKLIDSDEGALLLEYIDGPSLADKLSETPGQDQDAAASEIICDVLDKLHSCAGPRPANTHDLKRQFKSLFARAKRRDSPDIYRRTASVARELIDTEESRVLLHGDIHHANILESRERRWLAIDPQPFYGERSYDVANAFFNPDDLPELVESAERVSAMAGIFARRLKVDERRVLKFAYAHGGLSSSWQLDDGENPERRLRITGIIESVI